MFSRRSSGVLLHPGSLPGGTLGPEAYRFVDWLEAAGQSWWQILPLGPPDRYGSPYAARSAFAGWAGLCAEPDAAVSPEEIEAFRALHGYWLDDWAAYARKGAVADQVRFEREWLALRRYAAARGIRLIGDIPLYVADRSAEVASHPELFDRSLIGGVPPDLFTETGQLWGSPIYAWPAHRAEGYRWWIERFRRTFELVDIARLDHFRGFVAYWAVPAGAPTAESGRWLRGPGLDPFRAVEAELGGLPLIAEDLGVITPPVERLRDAIGAPGMRILQFGFGNPRSRDALANHPEHCVVYTGTHDNEPIAAWWRTASPAVRADVTAQLAAAGIESSDPAWALIELLFTSRARIAVVQMQDVLGLGIKARMNLPGTRGGNWKWRLEAGALTDELATHLREVTEGAGRLAGPDPS